MNHWFNLINILGSAVLVAFGLYVWRVEPGNRRNQAFVLYAVGFSLGTALSNIQTFLSSPGTILASDALRGLLYGLGGVGAAVFGVATVEPDRRTALKWLAVPGLLAVAGTGAEMQWFISSEPFSAAVVLNVGFYASLLGGSLFTALLLAEDFRRPGRSAERRREWAVLAAALVLYPGFYLTRTGAISAVRSLGPSSGAQVAFAFSAAALFGTLLLVVVEWVLSTRVPEVSTAARNVALLAAGMGAVGLGIGLVVTNRAVPGNFGVPFLARTGAVLILGYGVLRHQMLGLDEKVEFGVSRTTVAGVFVAVFFVVSEGAQVLFAGFAGSEFLGVLAAGALVFFLAPIQRMADRFAASAVPGGAKAGADAEERYKEFAEMALADGDVSREEERRLAQKADELGIDTTRALELREQVEDEQDGGDEP